MTQVRLDPVASGPRVKHSTTEPLRSLRHFCDGPETVHQKIELEDLKVLKRSPDLLKQC